VKGLADLIAAEQETLVARWCARVRPLAPRPDLTRETIVDSLPDYLADIVTALRSLNDPSTTGSLPVASPIAEAHGKQRDQLGFSVNAVAKEYPLLHEEILALASERGVGISAGESIFLARCIGTGAAEALSHFAKAGESELLRQAAVARSEQRQAARDLENVRAAVRRASESEHRLRVLIDTLPFLIAFVDKDERYILNNRAYLSWFGLEDVTGRRVSEVLAPATYGALRGHIQRALAGEPVEYEAPMQFGEGRSGWVRGTYVPLRDAGDEPQGFVALVENITERRALQKQIEGSEQRLREALAVTGAGTFEFDLLSGEGKFDAQMREITRWRPEVPITIESTTEQVHPADRPAIQAAFERALTQGVPYIVEHRIVAEPGDPGEPEPWVSARGGVLFDVDHRPVRFIGTAVDVTEQHRAVEALALIFEHGADMMAMISRQGRFLRVNPAFVRTLGWTSEELIQKSFRDLVHPEDAERTQAEYGRLLQGASTLNFENRYRRKDGVYRWLSWSAAPLPDRSRVYCTARDVTGERDRAEFEQHLIGIVSHDLRNPLQAILLAARGLLRLDTADEKTMRAAGRIQAAADRAVRLVADLLDFTQARTGGGIRVVRQLLDFHQRVRATVEEVEAVHPDRCVKLTSEGDATGSWDGDRVAQITENLLTNALKYSPAQSEVRVHTRGEADEVILEVHNQGPPIPPDLLPRIFSPMQRASAEVDRQSRSVGLGLHIVRHLVEAHGGTIQVWSSKQEGTLFRVQLPKHASET
jgi:PAS domain S-box-containing protein